MAKCMPYKKFDAPFKGAPLLVFVAGYPDSELSAFGKMIEEFKEEYEILSIAMPGMDTKTVENRDFEKIGWGHAFTDIPYLLKNTIIEALGKTKPYVLVGHDWGAYVCGQYINEMRGTDKKRVSQLILLDVGSFGDVGMFGAYTSMVIAIYQGLLALAFFLYKLFGEFIGMLPVKMFFILCMFFPFFSPTMKGDRMPRRMREFHVSMCWPYFRFWTAPFLRQPKLPVDTPFLFIYGKRKNIMFHTDTALSRIAANPIQKYAAVDAGHWLQVEKSEEVAKLIRDFVK